MKEQLNRIIDGHSLSQGEAANLIGQMIDEELSPVQLAGFLVALRAKGETADEVAGFAEAMRDRARQVVISTPLADTCGTGGDNQGTFNISTAAAIVLAACGQPVAKHGNRAASGLCGSADVLEAVGVEIGLSPEGVTACIEQAGIAFLFAPVFHPAMKFAALPRRELGVRTVFNLLGPLTNPARPHFQLLGVGSEGLLDLMAGALAKLGTEHALVVHSIDGLDEISISGPTSVREVSDGRVIAYEITPEDFGIQPSARRAVEGGDVSRNAEMLLTILDGDRIPARDAALVNAAAALYAAQRAPNFRAGYEQAAAAVDSGAARTALDRFKTVSRQVAGEN